MSRRHPDGENRFYDKKLGYCPVCEEGQPEFSSHLHRSKLDNHLWAQAAEAEKTRKLGEARAKGYDIPPTKEQRRIAKQIVSDSGTLRDVLSQIG